MSADSSRDRDTVPETDTAIPSIPPESLSPTAEPDQRPEFASSTTPNSTRQIYVIDDDPALLEMLRLTLLEQGYSADCYISSQEFVDRIPELSRGIVITDQFMIPISGLEVQSRLLSRRVDFRVIMITGYPRVDIAVRAMKQGAITVLDKPFQREDLLQAVQEGFKVLDDLQDDDQDLPPVLPQGKKYAERLSGREKQVVELVYEGATNKCIGIRLGISIKTVERHRANAMKKLEVNSLAKLIRLLERDRSNPL
jgi:FixJ family two-component response regulator